MFNSALHLKSALKGAVTLAAAFLILAHAQSVFATESIPTITNEGTAAQPAVSNQAAPLPQVRIGLKITPFRQIVSKAVDGKNEVRHEAEEPLKHTLKARLNKVNHFYVGAYHIETRPLKWVREAKHYEVQLTLFRQFGKTGEVEETLGTLAIQGVLTEQPDGVYWLNGSAFKRFRDKFNAPIIDVAAGYRPATGAETAKAPADERANQPSSQRF